MRFFDDLFSLKGNVALVTGASSGIGRAMALALAGAGAAVVHVARGEADLRRAVAEAREAGGQADCVAGDVGRIESLPELVERAGAIFGPPDILVNAAGVNPRKPWPEVTTEVWDQTLRLNLGAPFFLAKLLV
ncbi:MAG: SDR family NAD(P)-dependent oxidoreductase, partial [Desulfobacterales bacterium]|nr:SDR family NAD(P)-dependent oxidoreductase [Desulfobacterales bacterium]